jgi:hypothetical protein
MGLLAKILGFDRRTVSNRLEKCPKTGAIGGSPAFLLKDAAKYLYANEFYADVDELKPADRKAFWESELKKLEFEIKTKEVILSQVISTKLADIFKDMDLHIAKMCDEIERECGLDVDQRDSVERQLDELRSKLSRIPIPSE